MLCYKHLSLQERNNEPPVPANTNGSVDEVTRQGQQMENDAKELTKAQHRAPDEVGQSEEDEGSLLTKLRKMVGKPLSHVPSLALNNPVPEDGVLQRPCENGVKDGRDLSPDRNDSDSISAYEDASSETPEHERMFPGEADPLELPDDSEDKEKSSTNSCQVNDSETQDPKNPEACVVS